MRLVCITAASRVDGLVLATPATSRQVIVVL
jgi:hypothetical protein